MGAITWATAATAVLAMAGSWSASARPFEVDDLVRLKRISDMQIDSAGKRAVFVLRETDFENDKGLNSLFSLDLAAPNAKPQRLTQALLSSVHPRFAADGRSVYFLSSRGGSMQVWQLGLSGGEATQVTRAALDVGSFSVLPGGAGLLLSFEVHTNCGADFACTIAQGEEKFLPKVSGQVHDKLFIRHWDTVSDGTRAQLFAGRFNESGEIADYTHLSRGIDGDVPSKPFGGAEDYAVSADGKTAYFAARIAGKTEPWSTNFDLYAVAVDGSTAPVNLTADNLAWDGYPVVSPDGKTLAYRAMSRPGFEADRWRLMLRDLSSGQTREVAADWDRSADHLSFAPDGKSLLVSANSIGEAPLFRIDIASGKVRQLIAGGQVADYAQVSGKLYFVRSSLAGPAELYSAALDGSAQRAHTALNADALRDVQFGAFEQFQFEGAEGHAVYGWLVKPAGFDPSKKYPVAYLIHGGPQGSFMNQFHYRWNAQTYAGQGFVTVMVDFHGSTGYGQAFTDSISGDWGGKPLVDLQKGLAAVGERYPFADIGRACALGGSYGGYMVNWIAGNWPEGFKCLVNHAGVFDTRFMGYATEELWFSEWENGGTPYEKPESYERFNPVNYVKNWATPVLVIHGQKDYRVPFEQGIAAFTAAQRRGIDSKFLWYPDENHWILRPQNSVQWHRTVEAWLKQHTDQ